MLSKWDHIAMAVKRLPRPERLRNRARSLTDEHMLLLNELRRREKLGQIATLREAHTILNASQSKALKMVCELEDRGLLEIDKETFDRLSSLIALTENGRKAALISGAA